MNKICTSIEQSKKLIELGIDVNTADMVYLRSYFEETGEYNLLVGSYHESYAEKEDGTLIPVFDEHIHAWSLTALLSILPFHLIVNNKIYKFGMSKGFNKSGETYAIKYSIFNTTFYLYLTNFYNNPIDAAFEMIIWLKENKKL